MTLHDDRKQWCGWRCREQEALQDATQEYFDSKVSDVFMISPKPVY
jgi:hypothetical protein